MSDVNEHAKMQMRPPDPHADPIRIKKPNQPLGSASTRAAMHKRKMNVKKRELDAVRRELDTMSQPRVKEEVNEKKLSTKEKNKKDEIFKALDVKDFEKRYGDEAEKVMHAVATKNAKKTESVWMAKNDKLFVAEDRAIAESGGARVLDIERVRKLAKPGDIRLAEACPGLEISMGGKHNLPEACECGCADCGCSNGGECGCGCGCGDAKESKNIDSEQILNQILKRGVVENIETPEFDVSTWSPEQKQASYNFLYEAGIWLTMLAENSANIQPKTSVLQTIMELGIREAGMLGKLRFWENAAPRIASQLDKTGDEASAINTLKETFSLLHKDVNSVLESLKKNEEQVNV